MRSIIAILLILLFSGPAYAQGLIQTLAGISPALASDGGETCTTVADSSGITSGGGMGVGDNASTEHSSGAFVATDTYSMCKVDVWLDKTGSPNDTLKARVYGTTSSLPGTQTGQDSDGVLTTSYSSGGWVTFTFSGTKPSITSGDTFWIDIYTTDAAGDWSNYATVGYVVSLCTVGAEWCLQTSPDGATWTDFDNSRLMFKAYK